MDTDEVTHELPLLTRISELFGVGSPVTDDGKDSTVIQEELVVDNNTIFDFVGIPITGDNNAAVTADSVHLPSLLTKSVLLSLSGDIGTPVTEAISDVIVHDLFVATSIDLSFVDGVGRKPVLPLVLGSTTLHLPSVLTVSTHP